MKEYIKKLLKVKSLVTFAITAVMCYLAISGKVEPEKIIIIYSSIIGFYFGTQSNKGDEDK